MRKIAITTTTFAKFDNTPIELCRQNGFEVILNPYKRKITSNELINLARESVGIIAGTEQINKNTLSNLPFLKAISRCGVGLENIDLDAAKKNGIKISNTLNAPTLAVAELTVGLILNLMRRVNFMDVTIRKGRWEKLIGNLLYGKKIGIIGFGRIGQKVGELLSSFNVELAYCDIKHKTSSINCVKKSLNEILKWADIITLHVSASKGKKAVIGRRELNLMKKDGWLVNVSRGDVVDENALHTALKNNHLSGAALDVFEQEPYIGPLKKLNNIILTPHIGSYAKEARIRMEKEAVENLLKGLQSI